MAAAVLLTGGAANAQSGEMAANLWSALNQFCDPVVMSSQPVLEGEQFHRKYANGEINLDVQLNGCMVLATGNAEFVGDVDRTFLAYARGKGLAQQGGLEPVRVFTGPENGKLKWQIVSASQLVAVWTYG